MKNTLQDFLEPWEIAYDQATQRIDMFDRKRRIEWSLSQRTLFARLFFHARAQFGMFLWYVGSMMPTREAKNAVLANISDEFGLESGTLIGPSHEALYRRFAAAVGVSEDAIIREEILGEWMNLPFLEKFNRGHLEWILSKPLAEVWAAFAAYEALDNPDARNLLFLFRRFSVAESDLAFFEVHCRVRHAEAALPVLKEIWERDQEAVRAGFRFITEHQLKMWQHVSDIVFAHRE